MSSNLITTNNFKTKKLSLGNVQNKKSKEVKDYQNIPILYEKEIARIRMSGRFRLKEFDKYKSLSKTSFGELSLVVQVDDDNRKLFEEFEEKLSSLSNYQLRWIKKDNVYLKIYNKPNGKMHLKFWQLFEKDGKEFRKTFHNPENLIDKNFEGEVVLKLDKIFNGKIKKGKDSIKSIISVAEEILVREILEEQSHFEEEYPVLEESIGK